MGGFWQQSQKWQPLLVPFLTVIVITVLSLVVVIPQGRALISDIRGIGERREDLEALKEKVASLGSVNAAQVRTQATTLSRAVPSSDDLGFFLLSVRSMANRAGITFSGVQLVAESQTFSPTPRERPQAGRELVTKLSVQLEGDFMAVERFLQEVETSLPLSKVSEFSFSRDEGGGALAGKVHLTFFYLTDPETLGKISSPLPVVTAAEARVLDMINAFRVPEISSETQVPRGKTNFML